ncbi:phytanoyl-CoA dioxygenase family protein [Kiloniella sp. EL199]|uniref:phytanoyl-CoA dioxygenase family protein n=1 Tax=Kiloniella sp. EL199 TaxID=2107581 RepID=UPI000EA10041|nr:phytanoyl-CoA dioxygenase family protein [Kiloniella sp. EL199]
MLGSFNDEGVFFAKKIIPNDLINGLLEEIITLSQEEETVRGGQDDLFSAAEYSLLELLQSVPADEYLALLRAIKSSVWVRQIATCSGVVEMARKLLNSSHISQRGNPVLHLTGDRFQLSDKSLAAPWHQDWPALRSSKRTLVVWVPLGGAENSGALKFKLGSHKAGLIKTSEIEAVYEIDPDEIHKYETVQRGVPVGDAVFFDSLTAHSSEGTQRLRMALSFRFEDLSCDEWKKRKFTSSHIDGIEKRELTDAEKNIFS